MAELRRAGLEYDRRRRLIVVPGPEETWNLPFRYLGADDRAGPNYTGQPAVDSYYDDRMSGSLDGAFVRFNAEMAAPEVHRYSSGGDPWMTVRQ